MKTCKCGRRIPSSRVNNQGKTVRVRRLYCFDCVPLQGSKKRTCKTCGKKFPPSIVIDGKRHSLKCRIHCPSCTPIGDRSKIWKIKRAQPRGCKDCKKTKDPKEFWGVTSICKPCTLLRQKKKRKRIKEQYVDFLGGRCMKCDYDKCLAALDFHHRDSKDKEFTISQHRRVDFEEVKKELLKCDLLCRNCHAELHDE